MAYKSLLSVLTDSENADATLRQLIALAQSQDAHADILCLGVDRTQSGYYYAGLMLWFYRNLWRKPKTRRRKF